MKRYRCTIRQEVNVFHECVVLADSPADAAVTARRGWYDHAMPFTNVGTMQTDHIYCTSDDCEEIRQ
jgi:hypothetical protein